MTQDVYETSFRLIYICCIDLIDIRFLQRMMVVLNAIYLPRISHEIIV